MNEWKPYLNDRLIKECDGFYVIKPTEERQIVPLACPVCDYLMRTADDEKSYREFECCESCETHWARPRLHSWREGWRPTKEKIEEKFGGRKKITVNMLF
jgi:hypothetical protein